MSSQYAVHAPDYEASTVNFDFDYTSSNIGVGTVGREQDFKGIIHETRLYDFALSAQQVQDVTDELCMLYK